jgi:hypothetical protein
MVFAKLVFAKFRPGVIKHGRGQQTLNSRCTMSVLPQPQPAARRPFALTAAPLSLLPRSRLQASAAMRIRWAPRNLRARASQGRTIAASPATLFRDPVRSPPRGCHARLVARWLDQRAEVSPKLEQDTKRVRFYLRDNKSAWASAQNYELRGLADFVSLWVRDFVSLSLRGSPNI